MQALWGHGRRCVGHLAGEGSGAPPDLSAPQKTDRMILGRLPVKAAHQPIYVRIARECKVSGECDLIPPRESRCFSEASVEISNIHKL